MIQRFHDAGIETRVINTTPARAWAGRFGRLRSKIVNFHIGFVTEPRRLAAVLREEQVDLVHLNNSITSNHVWMLAASRAGVPCITHERGINDTYSARSKWLGSRLRAVVCISNAVRENLVRKKLGGLRLVTIPNGLDPADMVTTLEPEAVRNEFGIAPGSRLVGLVGNIKHWKGQEVLIRAMSRLRTTRPEVACLLIGDASESSGPYLQSIRRLITDLKLSDRVFITGYRANVADYVNACDVVVHASVLPEPFGRVILEGMALRKPVIGARAGGVPEIIDEPSTGLLYTPGDDAELADCIGRLISDESACRSMGEAGYRRLVETFSIQRNVQLTQELYSSILRLEP
jgi:glycosyltransferase involved in cell wall biosynthesis